MDPIRQRLTNHSIIGLDTSIFIYHFESHPNYLPLTRFILNAIHSGQCKGITSVVTLMELTVHPWQQGNSATAQIYEASLSHFPNLTLVDINRDIARRAAQLRANYRLRPADALQVGASLYHQATAFLTNDHKLKRLVSLIDIIVLDECSP